MASPPAASPTTRHGRANLIIGLPDDGRTRYVLPSPCTPPRLFAEGNAGFLPHVEDLWERAQPIWLGPSRERFELKLLPGAALANSIADPDACSIALAKAARLAAVADRPCFNHPAAVQATTREAVARRLAGIAGLIVPRTIRVAPGSLAGLMAAIDGAALAFPVLVRIAGDHGGVSLLKLDDRAALETTLPRGLLGRTLYVTEFRDFVSRDGLWRKHRLVVVGDELLMRHLIIGRSWLLHAASRAAGSAAEEAAALESFASGLRPQVAGTIAEIARRLSLDYFGIDCHLGADGNLLLFEANACMDILAQPVPPPNIWEASRERIRDALRRLMLRPESWRGPAVSAPAPTAPPRSPAHAPPA